MGNTIRFPLGHWMGLFPWLMCLGIGHAAAPRFAPPIVSATEVSLRLVGDSGRDYRVEASTNLSTWFQVGRGTAVNGTLALQHAGPGSYPWLYYRAVQEGAVSVFPTVVPGVDTNLFTTTILLPDAPGRLRLEAFDGTIYTFTVPTNAVTEPTLVRMTVITNVAGFPSKGGWLSGVRLEPSRLILGAPGWLQMEFPGPIPGRQVASVGFLSDGKRFHLVPDVVVTNRVRIFVDQLKSYGSGVWTLDELRTQASTVPPAALQANRPGLHATMEECYPEDEAAAEAMRAELEEKIAPLRQRAAAELSEERQSEVLGVGTEDDGRASELLTQLLGAGNTFFREELMARIPDATQRCATTRELLFWMIGFERQRQLLGGSEDDSSFSNSPLFEVMCKGFVKCQEQALECCRTRGGDTRLIVFLLGIERQRQLLGVGNTCGDPIDIPELLEECAPKWFGTLSIVESGAFSTNRSDTSTISTKDEAWTYSLEANVVAVEEEIIEEVFLFFPAHTNLTFTIAGRFKASHTDNRDFGDKNSACGGGSQRSLLGRGLHDGFLTSQRKTQVVSGLLETNSVFKVSARLMAPGTGIPFLNPLLQSQVPSFEVRKKGMVRWVTETKTDSGCDTEILEGPPSGMESFWGLWLDAEQGEFTYTGDGIQYSKDSKSTEGELEIRQSVRINFYRVRP